MADKNLAIPVCEPSLGTEELANVTDCVKSGWISGWSGKYIEQFEQEFSTYCGARYGVTTSNCGTAILLALECLGIGQGDEVIVPSFTMTAPVFAVIKEGAKPMLVDAAPDTWTMDVRKIEDKITRKTKAILPVHIYGHPVHMVELLDIASIYGVYVIEDAAEAHGAECNGHRVGCLGNAGCFSFYINKIITTGEGGMLVTNDARVADRAKLLKNYAHPLDHSFFHGELGFNYRMTNMQAAIGCAQMQKIDCFVKRKRQIAALYTYELRNVEGLILPSEAEWAWNVYWVYGVVVKEDFGMTKDVLRKRLAKKGIETRDFFAPMHWQPVFAKMGLFVNESYPVAEKLSRQGMYLPNGVTLTDEQVLTVCEAIKEIQVK